MPSQNTGIATSIDVESVTSTSQIEYFFTAEMIPAPTPTMISMMMAASASSQRVGIGLLQYVGDRLDPCACSTPRSPWASLLR